MEMAIIASTINAYDSFLIPLIEIWFGDDEVISQNDNASCHKAKGFKVFLRERYIKLIIRPVNSPDVNPIENL